jgi:hypothetical protein
LVPEGHLAWFILDVVDQLDLQPFYRIHRDDGHGHPAYDPKLLLGRPGRVQQGTDLLVGHLRKVAVGLPDGHKWPRRTGADDLVSSRCSFWQVEAAATGTATTTRAGCWRA